MYILKATKDAQEVTMPGTLDIEALQQTLRRFAADRDWEQFHSPKNLPTALSVEASELVEVSNG